MLSCETFSKSTIEQAFASAQKEIQARIGEATQLTPAERAQLARLTKEQQSWNPFVRNAGRKEAVELHARQHARYEAELAKATRNFESGDAQRIQTRIRSDERMYREYVSASLGLEDQMRRARTALRDGIPKVEGRLTVLGRAGVAMSECEGSVWRADLDRLAAPVDHLYRALPHELRRDVELALHREQRALHRSRESISMDRQGRSTPITGWPLTSASANTYNIHTVEVRWDARKAATNYRKHGVAFADAATSLDDPQALTIEDRRFAEQRFVTLGLDALGRLLAVVYVYPASADAIRLISARRATASEKRQYYGKES